MARYALAILLCLVPSIAEASQTFASSDLKSDYLKACELIASKYVYFERKNPLSRAIFLQRSTLHADSVVWTTGSFIRELRSLRARFPDGHFSWRIPQELSPIDGFYTLGFVPTFTADSNLVVKAVYPYYTPQFHVNDRIVAVNGRPAVEFIRALARLAPQSTPGAT